MNDIIYYAIGLVLSAIGFVLGKYVFPKIKIDSKIIETISSWVYKFVVSAKNQFEGKYTGEQKLAYVTEQVKALCAKYKVQLTDEQIRALIEDAYDLMKQGGAIMLGTVETDEKVEK